jgi:hypothetical protein
MTPQLQLGPLETGPFVDQEAPATEQVAPSEAPAVPVSEAPMPEALPTGDAPDFFSEGPVADMLAETPEAAVPPSKPALEYAASIYTLAGGGQGQMVTAESVREALTQDIGRAEIQFVLDEIRASEDGMQREMLLETIQNPRLQVEAKIELMKELDELSGLRRYDVNAVQRQALSNIVLADRVAWETPEDQQRADIANVEVEMLPEGVDTSDKGDYTDDELYTSYATLLNAHYTEAEESSSLLSKDFLATMLPFRFNVPVASIYNELKIGGEDVVLDATGTVLVGEALKQIREYIEGATTEQKVDALKVVLRHLKPNSGVFSDGNDFVTMHLLSEIFYKDLTGGRDYYDDAIDPLRINGEGVLSLTQFFDNVGGILDTVMLGGLARGTIKLGSRLLPKSMRTLNRISPKTAAEIAATIANNPALAERLGGAVPAQWMENILPSHRTLLTDGGVNGVEEVMARQAALAKEMQELAGRTSMTMAQRADALAEIDTLLRTGANAQPSALHPARTHIADTGTGIEIKGVFGRDAHNPFNTIIDAREAAKLTFNDAPFELLMEQGGKLVPVPAGRSPTMPGRYFFEVQETRAYDSAQKTVGQLTFGADDVSATRFMGRFWNAIKNPGSVFSREVNDAMSAAVRERYVWSKLTESLTNNFNSLNRGQQQQLSAVLKEGERIKTATGRGTTFTVAELAQRGLGDHAIRAYYEARGAMDVLHNVTNSRLRAQYQAAGLQQVMTPSGAAGLAKLRSTADEAWSDAVVVGDKRLMHAFDPVAKQFVVMGEHEIKNLYHSGASLARLKTPMLGKGAEEATHIIVDGAKKVEMRALPRQVINKVEGYYPHMWDSNFVVYGITKGGSRVAMGLAKTAADAKAAVARMKAANKGQKFQDITFDFDRSLRDPAYRSGMIDDLYLNLGGPVYGERSGGILKNFSKSSGDHMVDPIEAMVRGMELVGQQVTKGELVQHMRNKLQNFLVSEGIALKNPRKMPITRDDIMDNAAKAAEVQKARVYLDQINMFQRTPDAVDAFTSNFLKNASMAVGEVLGGKVGNRLATALADKASKGFEPLSWLSSVAHKTIIATAPVTHLALQSMQSMVMLGVAPRAYFSALRQLTGLTSMFGLRTLEAGGNLMSKADWDKAYRAASKAMGMPEAEVRALTEAFYNSGLVDAVSHNSIIRQNLRSAAEARRLKSAQGISGGALRDAAGRVVRGVDDKVFGTLGKIGFEAGENINQMLTFLSFYNADRKAGKAFLDNADYVRSLIGRTAEISGNMVPEMGFSYQRGWFKTAMQFVSFQHKMLMMMLPEMMGGSRALTGPQKAGIVLTQFLMYGRRGAPHIDAFYRVVDKQINGLQMEPEEKQQLLEDWRALKPVMDGFLGDYMTNGVLKELYGEQTPEFGFGERLAPGGGTEFMMERLIAIANNPTVEVFGMGGQKVSRLADWGAKVFQTSLGQAQGLDDVPIDVRAEELAKSGGALLFSQYNKILAVQAARLLDGWTTAGGNVSQAYSGELEGSLFKLFGVNTKERDELYRAMDAYQERMETDTSFRDNELREVANKYYQDLVFQSIHAQGQTTSDQHYDNLMDLWTRERNLLFSMMDKQDAARVHELVSDKITAALRSKDPAEQQFIERLTKSIRENHFGADGPEVSSYLMQQDFVKNNPRLLELVHDAFLEAHADGESE